MAIYLAVRACINAGDEVLIPTPSWVSYSEIVRAASGVPVEVPLNDQDNYKITAAVFEKYVSNKTTMLIINSPNNPTGRVLNEQEINELSSFLYKKDIVLLSDEVYEKILFDNRKSYSPAAYADLKSKTLTVNGFSKAYAMTGWRLGYIVGDKKYIEEINKLYTHTITGTPPFIQEAAIVALDCNEHVENMRREYQCRRDYFIKSLNEISGVYAHSPEGAFYAWAKIENRENLATFILDRAKVIGVPGKAYGSIWGNYIRFSFANKMDDLIETIKRLNTLLGEK
jgi:aspartate aminotransferase